VEKALWRDNAVGATGTGTTCDMAPSSAAATMPHEARSCESADDASDAAHNQAAAALLALAKHGYHGSGPVNALHRTIPTAPTCHTLRMAVSTAYSEPSSVNVRHAFD